MSNNISTFTQKEKSLLKKLNTPAKAQDFLNSLSFNFEKSVNYIKSERKLLPITSDFRAL